MLRQKKDSRRICMEKSIKNLLLHLVNGGEVKDKDDNIMRLTEVVLDDTQYSIEDLSDLEIYVSPLQIEIDRLKEII